MYSLQAFRAVVLAAAFVILAATFAAHAQSGLEPGLWKIAVNTTVNGVADPDQDLEECLGRELDDLAAYFAPRLEGLAVQCRRAREPSSPEVVAYRMQCRGAGFSIDAATSTTIESPVKFTLKMRIDTRTDEESAVVIANADGRRVAACQQQ